MKQHAIERLLPTVYQVTAAPGSPLDGLLAAMEQLHEADEEVLRRIDEYFDPYRAPADFVPFLAHWADLGWLVEGSGFPAGVGRLRNLVSVSPELSRLRGTAPGLRRFLETATCVEGFLVEDGGTEPPFHVTVTAPPSTERLRPLLELIVRTERPAHATYELRFAAAE